MDSSVSCKTSRRYEHTRCAIHPCLEGCLSNARFVVPGQRDVDKAALFLESANMHKSFIMILTELVANFHFIFWSKEVSQAYVQWGRQLLLGV